MFSWSWMNKINQRTSTSINTSAAESKAKSKNQKLPKASQHKDPRATMISPCCCEDGWSAPASGWRCSAVWMRHGRGEGNTRGTHSSNYKQALSWVWNQKWQQQWAARHTHIHTHTHTRHTQTTPVWARVIIWTNQNCSGSVMSGRC